MRVDYGAVEFALKRILGYQAEKIYDEHGTYLNTETTFTLECVYNSETHSYTQPAQVNGNPGRNTGNLAAQTESAIRHHFSQPRKLFRVVDRAGNVLFNTPDNNLPCDAKNGPLPTLHSVQNNFNDKSWKVVFSIKTWQNECNGRSVTNQIGTFSIFDTPLLSYEWRGMWGMMENFWQYAVFSGRAVFDAAWLRTNALSPDDFKHFLINELPIPGFRQGKLEVVQEADGITYSWVATEKQVKLAWESNRIVNIDVQHTGGYSVTDPVAPILATGTVPPASTTTETIDQTGNQVSRTRTTRSTMTQLSASGGQTLAAWAGRAFQSLLPIFHKAMYVRVEGRPGTNIAHLKDVAWQIAEFRLRLGQILTNLNTTNHKFEFRINLPENYVELHVSVVSGLLARAFNSQFLRDALNGVLQGNINRAYTGAENLTFALTTDRDDAHPTHGASIYDQNENLLGNAQDATPARQIDDNVRFSLLEPDLQGDCEKPKYEEPYKRRKPVDLLEILDPNGRVDLF